VPQNREKKDQKNEKKVYDTPWEKGVKVNKTQDKKEKEQEPEDQEKKPYRAAPKSESSKKPKIIGEL